MTHEEAIYCLTVMRNEVLDTWEFDFTTEETDALKLALEAMELQVPKKVTTIEGGCGRKIPICPSCECLLAEYEIAGERCCECGQLLDTEDWSEE